MFDGCLKPRRELCTFTVSGYNTLADPTSDKEINIRTGFKNTPARSSRFCTDCEMLTLKNEGLGRKFKGSECKSISGMSKELK